MPSPTAPLIPFKRHSRPQPPTVPTPKPRVLNVQSKPSWIPAPPTTRSRTTPKEQAHTAVRSDWISFIQLGKIVQGDSEFIVCSGREDRSKLFMFKFADQELDQPSEKSLSFQHRDLLTARYVIASDVGMHIGYDYARYTLHEILNVHVPLEEIHVRAIAKAVFRAIQYLNEEGFLHGRISTETVRVCGQTGKILLGDCNGCTQLPKQEFVNTDFELLGLLLLECMEGKPRLAVRTADEIRKERATNKVFGLSQPERWSGCKQLMDFLDDLFGIHRRPLTKLRCVHDYVDKSVGDDGVLYPLVEMASMECFTMWHSIE